MYVLPLGGKYNRLGSLDFLASHQMSFDDMFGASTEVISGKGKKETPNASLPMLDLIAINPPFTRSVGGNLLFGSVPEARRGEMQKRLKQLVTDKGIEANITAGLGSVFVALANRHLNGGGRIALVLPKAVLNGVAWGPTRSIFQKGYVVEHIFSSHDPERWNFSESTDLSEVMLIARKLKFKETDRKSKTVYVNFYRNPTNIIEALSVSHQLRQITPGDLSENQGASRITLGSDVIAEVVSVPWDFLRTNGSFMWGTAFAQSDLTRVLIGLTSGKLRLPGQAKDVRFPVVDLNSLGRLGPDRRDIHDGFKVSNAATSFACVWGRDAKTTCNLKMAPNAYLVPLAKAQAGRNLRKVEDLWPLASDVLIAERLWLMTQSLLAVRTSEPVLSNMWWTFALEKPSVRKSKALVMWLNSSLGILSMLGCRLETRGAWITFKKPVLAALPVLDVRELNSGQIKALANGFDHIQDVDLLPFPEMATDPTRETIDDIVATALGLPGLGAIRKSISREPIICLKRL